MLAGWRNAFMARRREDGDGGGRRTSQCPSSPSGENEEDAMKKRWRKPTIREIRVGLEINGYCSNRA